MEIFKTIVAVFTIVSGAVSLTSDNEIIENIAFTCGMIGLAIQILVV